MILDMKTPIVKKISVGLAISAAAHAAEVKFVGVQQNPHLGRFGGSGFYLLAPGGDVGSEPADEGKLTAHGTLARRPDFLAADPQAMAGLNWVNYPGYAEVAPPGGGDKLRIGGISATMNGKGEVEGVATLSAIMLSFQLSADVEFRLGVMVDAFNERGAYAPDFVGVREDATNKTVYCRDVIVRDGNPDLLLFDIDGKAGATYTVELHRAALARGTPVTGLSALTFDRASRSALPAVASDSAAVGEFQRAGEYFKDYYVFKEGDTFHLFYNFGHAGPVQDWRGAGNENAFGHATSKDLRHWKHHPSILPAVPGTWEGMAVSAPSVVKHDGVYYMVYTGFDDRWVGMQTIGLATGTDLFHWRRHPGNPVYRAPKAWAKTNPKGWENCRDAHILRYEDEFLMYTMVETKQGEGAIALASSEDAVNWKDLGPALITFEQPESPRVFEHDGTYYMFASSGYGRVLFKSKDPKSTAWEQVPFNWPANSPEAKKHHYLGIWSGWEVVEYEGKTVFSAFYWKPHGGLIRFWEVKWNGDVPTVIYEKQP